MKTDLLQDIKDKISECIPDVLFVDLYREQDKRGAGYYPFPLPAVLIELQRIRWENASRGAQTGDCTVVLHLLQHDVQDIFTGASAEAAAIADMQLATDLWNCMEGLRGQLHSGLNRTEERFVMGHVQMYFECKLYESVVNGQQTVAGVEMVVKSEE